MDSRKQFEFAFVDEMVSRCGEGFRSSAWLFFVEKEEDGSYSNPIAHAGWWAWQASRESLVVELPPVTIDMYGQSYGYYCASEAMTWARAAIEEQGIRTK